MSETKRGRVLWLDAFGGLAGDMLLGALLDLGLDARALREQLASLELSGWSLRVAATERRGVGCTAASFELAPDRRRPHRHLPEILRRIAASTLPKGAREGATRTFILLAEAEAKVHRIAVDEVHFHEVGADDAILDICGVAFGLHALGADGIVCPGAVPAGTGTVRCAHGELPCPAPAVVELLAGTVELLPGAGEGEMVTPTGAALLSSYRRADRFGPLVPVRVGYGAGTRTSSVLRLTLADAAIHGSASDAESDEVVVLTTHLDDMTGEQLAFLLERCFAAGAVDAGCVPMLMKKGRPGHQLTVLAAPGDREQVIATIFHHSTTLGLREQATRRRLLPRRARAIATPWGEIRIKDAGGRARPEYEDLARVAREHGLALAEVERRVCELVRHHGEGEGR